MRTEKRRKPFFLFALLLLLLCQGCTAVDIRQAQTDTVQESAAWEASPEDKQNEPYAVLNGNVPYFMQEEKQAGKRLKITVSLTVWDDAAWLMPISARSLCRRRSAARLGALSHRAGIW